VYIQISKINPAEFWQIGEVSVSKRPSHLKPKRFRFKPICASLLLVFTVQTTQANPIGAAIVNGQASFATSGNTLTITNTPNTIINWQGFSIGANEITRFAQQSASSAVLNRVIANNPSSILGSLQSNGRVFLVNPSGIVFGANATVNVAGMVASTLNLSNADFLAGRYKFSSPLPLAGEGAGERVVNNGNITAHGDGLAGGQIYLIAPDVENTGIINAPNGEILLAAGHSVELVNSNDPNLRVNITAPAGDATNVGQLVAEAGSLGLFGAVVKNSGTVNADSATMQGGKIVFKAAQRTEISGTVSANGSSSGGTIQALGSQVGIMDGATVTTNGAQGGGTVLAGGDYQGKNPDVPNAQVTYVAPTAIISADATQIGNGGKIIIWSDNTTRAYGSLSARGGTNGGNGGFIETSGKQFLDAVGIHVNAGAGANGIQGQWLLDPSDITIVHSIVAGTPIAGGFFDPAAVSGSVLDTDINATLNVGTDVIIQTSAGTGGTGIIVVNGSADAGGAVAISNTAGGTRGLTLTTAGTINIHSGVSITGSTGNALNVTLNATGGNTIAGTIDSSGGGIALTGATTLSGTIANGTIISDSTLNITGALDGVTLGGTTLNTSGSFYIHNGITLADGVTVNKGNGYWYFDTTGVQHIATTGTATLNSAGGVFYAGYGVSGQTLQIDSGVTMQGYGSIYEYYGASIINAGTIIGNTAGQTFSLGGTSLTNNGTMNVTAGTMSINPGTFTNSGTTNVSGGTLNIAPNGTAPNWTNPGTINLNSGILNLGGSFTATQLNPANYTRAAGTTVNLTSTLDNTGNTLDVGNAGLFGTGGLNSVSGTILNGTVLSTDAAHILNITGALDGVTLGGTVLNTSGNFYIHNGITLADGVTVNKGNGYWYFDTTGVQHIATTGTATLNSAGGVFYAGYGVSGQTLQIDSGVTMQGYGSIYEYYGASIINAGTINGNFSASIANFTNNGTLGGIGNINIGGGAGALNNNGIIAPGISGADTTGTLSITGNLVMGVGSSLNIDINSPLAGDYDKLNVSVTANLTNGTLNLSGGGGAGSYAVVNATGGLGGTTFAAINAGTFTQTPTYATTSLTLAATANSNPAIAWDGGAGTTNWADALNWSNDLAPTSASTLYIGSGAVTVSVTTAGQAANALTCDANFTLSAGDLTLAGASTFGGVTSISGGTLTGAGAITILTGGTLNWSGGTINGTVASTLTTQAGTTSNVTGGTLGVNRTWNSSGTLNLTLPSWINTSSLNHTAGILNLGGTFIAANLSTITRTGGTVNLTGTLDNTGATLDVGSAGLFGTGGLNSVSGTILNGTVLSTDAAHILNITGALDGVTLGGTVLNTSGDFTIYNDLTLATGVTVNKGAGYWYFGTTGVRHIATTGTASLNSAGGVFYAGRACCGGNTLQIDSGITVQGYGNFWEYYGASIINAGTIIGNTAGQTFSLGGTTFTNSGTMNVTAGTMTINPGTFINSLGSSVTAGAGTTLNINPGTAFTNAGTVTLGGATHSIGSATWTNTGSVALNTGSLNLGGTFTATQLNPANYTRAAGTTVNLSGTFDLATDTLDVGNAGLFGAGGLNSVSGTILNGTVLSTDAAHILNITGALDGVTLGGTTLNTSGDFSIYNGITLADGVTVNKDAGYWYFRTTGLQHIATTGMATLNSAGGAFYAGYGVSGQTLQVDSGVTVQGYGNFWEYYGASIINAGTIIGNTAGQSFNFYPGTFTNNGTMNVTAGTMSINPGTFINSGTTNVSGGTLNIAPSGIAPNWTNPGIINVSSGTLNLGGTFATAGLGTFIHTGGMLNLTGTLDNTGATLDIGSTVNLFGTSGLTSFSGTIKSGTLTNTDVVQASLNSTGGTLNGVTIGSNLALTGNLLINDPSGLAPTTLPSGMVLTNDGLLNVVAGALNMNGTYTGNTGSSVTISGGTLNTAAAFSTPTLNLTSGILNGTGSLTVTNSFNQTAGTLGNTFSSINITQAAGDLAVGSMGATGAVNLSAAAGFLGVNGVITSSLGDVMLSAVNGITQSADITVFGNVTLTANANGGVGNFIQGQLATIGNIDTVIPGNITINAYDIHVGATSSMRSVVLNAAHDVMIHNSGIIGGGLAQNFHVDDNYFAYTLPFGFTFYGVPYTTMYVSSNGLISFGAVISSTSGSVNATDANPKIVPAWRDWVTTVGANDIYIHQPNANALAVRWDVSQYGNTGLKANFEAVLSSTGGIGFNYGAATGGSYQAIGVSQGDGVHYTLSTYNNATSLNYIAPVQFTYDSLTGNYTETLGNSVVGIGVGRSVAAVADVSMVAVGTLNINNPITGASINGQSAIGVTLNAALTASGVGDAIVLNAGAGSFVNNVGATALTTPAGRWLVYSADPALDTFGELVSSNLALWGRTYAPASVVETGNRYLFSLAPTLTASVLGGDITKTYGADLTATPPAVTVAGLVDAALYGNVFVQDIYTGVPAAMSSGFAATALVNGGIPYVVTASGSITAPAGYVTAYNDVLLTVNPVPLTLLSVAANNASKIYGTTLTFSGTEFTPSGLIGTDAISTVTLTSLGTVNTANVGAYAITPSNATFSVGNASNYNITYVDGQLTVTPSVLTFVAAGTDRVYDGTNLATVTLTDNRFAWDAATLSTAYGTATFFDKNAAVAKPVNVTGITLTGAAAGNYTFNTATATTATITPAALILSAVTDTKVYDGGMTSSLVPTLTGTIYSGDNLSVLTQSFASAHVMGVNSSTLNVGSYTLNDGNGGANYTVSLNSSVGSITAATLTSTLTNTGVTKTYDGTTAAPVGFTPTYSIAGYASGDSAATLTSTGAAYNFAHVLTASNITVSGLALSGITGTGLTSDYVLDASSKSVLAGIAAAPLTSTASIGGTLNKTYDGTSTAAGATLAGTVTGGVAGDILSLNFAPVTLAYNGTNVVGTTAIVAAGAPTLTIASPTALSVAADYLLAPPVIANAVATITPAALTVTANALSKTEGNTDPLLTYITAGLKLSDTAATTLSGALARLAGETVGAYPINQGTLALLSTNYTISYVPADFSIAAAPALVIAATLAPVVTTLVNSIVVMPPSVPFNPPTPPLLMQAPVVAPPVVQAPVVNPPLDTAAGTPVDTPLADPNSPDDKKDAQEAVAVADATAPAAATVAAAPMPVCK